MKKVETRKFPEIPFSRLLSEKILPFSGPATLSDDQQAYEDGILLLSQERLFFSPTSKHYIYYRLAIANCLASS